MDTPDPRSTSCFCNGGGRGMGRLQKVVVFGGSGYLGQHILQGIADSNGDPHRIVAFTHHSNPPSKLLIQAFPNFLPFPVDLKTGHGLDAISHDFGQPHVVINCAAISTPRVCELDPTNAMSVNVPFHLVKWLLKFNDKILLIHLSSDQVYEGIRSFYKEEDDTVPVNVYGRSKKEAEEFISNNCSNFAILRSSIIFGPQPISPVPKSLPIQWIDGILSKGQKMEFFHDEFRCPIFVKDVVTIILALMNKWISEDADNMRLIMNMGGPNRVSRVQMAESVAHFRAYDLSLIRPISSLSVDLGVRSPADISMDISKLVSALGVLMTPLPDALKLTLLSPK